MATLPQFKQRQIARRSTSDIDRLAKQYKSSVDSLSGEYQTAFTGYQSGVAEKMKPFEAQMATYKDSLLPTYEAQRSAYQKKLDNYNVELADVQNNPGTVTSRKATIPSSNWFLATLGMTDDITIETFNPRPIPKFTEKSPIAPKAPTAPTVEEFDSSNFTAKKTEAESTFKREVDERRAAKLGAVSRRGSRPLLSGAQA